MPFSGSSNFCSASTSSCLLIDWSLIWENLGVTLFYKVLLMKPILDAVLCNFDVVLQSLLYISAIQVVTIKSMDSFAIL